MKVKLLGSGKKSDISRRIKTVATACKLSRAAGTVYDIYESCDDFDKNLNFIKRVINMGHESTIEHDYLVFALSGVSPIVEQTIIESRLTSFTIKSRREVDFRKVGYYVPKFRDKNGNPHPENSKITRIYKKHMSYLFNSYGDLVDNGINVEDARFILPYCFHSEIIMGIDARSLQRLTKALIYGKNSNIQELKELGMKFLDIINKCLPYLEERIKISDTDSGDRFLYLREKYQYSGEIIDTPKLIRYTPNTDEVILESTLMQTIQCSSEEAHAIVNKMSDEEKKEIFNTILNSVEQREFEQVSFQFQIPISLAVLTQLTRHRMHSLIVPDFVPMWNLKNYTVPASVKNYDEKYIPNVFAKNYEVYKQLEEMGVMEEDLIYFYLSGNMCNVLTTMNGRTLEWISRMRCCTKAQWQIRNIARELVRQTREVAPLFGSCLGATCEALKYCPEGKESCGRIKNN